MKSILQIILLASLCIRAFADDAPVSMLKLSVTDDPANFPPASG